MPTITGIQGLPVKLTETIGVQVQGSGNDGRTHSVRVRAYQGTDVVMDRTHPAGDGVLSINPNSANTFTLGGFPGNLDLWLSDPARAALPATILVELIKEGKGQQSDTVVQSWPTFEAQGI